MGKTSTTEMKKKKKGRPSLSDPKKPNPKQLQQQQQTLISSNPNFNTPNNRRSTRRNPSVNGISPESDVDGGDEDDDDERKEKKVKLVVRLPPFNQPRSNSGSYGSDSNADDDKPQISASGDRSVADQVEMVQKATDTIQGSVLESGPTTTPLPDKKLLMFILDRLQKKDIYGVFSEPVDPNELPDYIEIIEHPMDFGTVRKKLDEGRYPNLDEFEADVFLICSNAMQYNAPDTVYFRQARSIQELAKRDFENLRQVNDDGEPQPKIVRRGRPPGKNSKKSLGGLPLERVGPESASDATLATGGDNATGPNSYNLRREPAMSSRFRSNDALFRASHLSHNNDTYTDWSTEWNNEFPASILKAEAKHVKKQFSLDENRRATYRQFHPSVSGHEPSLSIALSGEIKQLMGVGLQFEHGYARSLARFAANLGPVAWKVASKKIEHVLPSGVKFGPGWVGENEAAPPRPSLLPDQKSSNNSVLNGCPLEHVTSSVAGVNSMATSGSSLPCKEVTLEAASRQNSGTDSAILKSGVRGTAPGPTFQTLQKNLLHSDRNGFNGVSGYDISSQMSTGRVRLSMPAGQSGLEAASVSRNNSTLTSPMVANHIISEPKLSGSARSTPTHCENVSAPCTAPPDSNTASEMVALSGVHPWPGVTMQQHRQYSLSVPPDLNVRFQAPGSPSSSFRTGSPQQPDLALQL